MNQYILGYGSLINLVSLSKTMKREMVQDDIIPVKLFNYRRVWNLKDYVYSNMVHKEISAIFLNLEYSLNSFVNGVIFKVSQMEFEYLAQRERNYSCIDVSNYVVSYENSLLRDVSIKIFIATDKKFLQDSSNNDCFVMKEYVKIVESGCMKIGDFFFKDYILTTAKIPFSLLEGSYRFQPIA